MGRSSTGAWTTAQALQLELKNLKPLLKPGRVIRATITYGSGASMGIEANLDGMQLRLFYTQTDREGVKKRLDYIVRLTSLPSNLGKGEVLYMLCPVSGKPCRILYSAYSSEYFKAREAYQNRLYYSSQLSSKLDKANDDYWRLQRRLEAGDGKRRAWNYAGKPTKRYLMLRAKRERLMELDKERFKPCYMPLSLRNMFQNIT